MKLNGSFAVVVKLGGSEAKRKWWWMVVLLAGMCALWYGVLADIVLNNVVLSLLDDNVAGL